MKYTIIILLLFSKCCLSQNGEKTTVSNETNKSIIIEYLEPIENYNVKINWTLIDSIPERKKIIGPATVEIKRLSDNKIFKVNYENYSITDSIYSEKIFKSYVNNSLPNILQLTYDNEESNFFFKDINFDNKEELIIIETDFEVEFKTDNYKIFEFGFDKLIEVEDFPIEALDWSGEIDYIKKELIVRDYLNCCDYNADFYKYESNNPEKFIYYKSEEHKVDPITEDEEITIKEKGKNDVIIFKKKQ